MCVLLQEPKMDPEVVLRKLKDVDGLTRGHWGHYVPLHEDQVQHLSQRDPLQRGLLVE